MPLNLVRILKEKDHRALKDHLDAIYGYVVASDEARDNARALVNEWNKDVELAKLHEEIDRLRSREYSSFTITPEEKLAIKEWKEKHINNSPACGLNAGAIGGKWCYEFIPTSLGEIGTIKCCCGAEFTFKEIG